MRFSFTLGIICSVLTGLSLACVDPVESAFNATVNVVVVDGTITNLPEPQVIRLNRSKADPLTGRFGTTPLTKATVEVVVDSSLLIACHETVDGSYQLPSDFRGQVGHAYQLRFTLPNGTHYQSTPQVLQPVPPISQVSATFNPTGIPQVVALNGYYRAGHDLFVDLQDPANQHNYYRWDWNLYEKQDWCRSCKQGVYAVNKVLPHVYRLGLYYVSGDSLYEDCFVPVNYQDAGQPAFHVDPYVYDYPCRTQCWEVLHNYDINVFDDLYSNGGLIAHRKVAIIPYYTRQPCLVELRQLSLTPDAYRYYKLLQDQTQNSGGLADTPAAAPIGNVSNTANQEERIVGYFTASAASTLRYWLDRRDVTGLPMGATDPAGPSGLPGAELFYALNLRQPLPEPTYPPPKVQIWGGPSRPPTALCVPSDTRTPVKPDGWRD